MKIIKAIEPSPCFICSEIYLEEGCFLNFKISKKILMFLPIVILSRRVIGEVNIRLSIILSCLAFLLLTTVASMEYYNNAKAKLKYKKIYWTAVAIVDMILLYWLFSWGLDINIINF